MPGLDPGIQVGTREQPSFTLSYNPSRRLIMKPDSSGLDPAIQGHQAIW
jgi:hypothetical protein